MSFCPILLLEFLNKLKRFTYINFLSFNFCFNSIESIYALRYVNSLFPTYIVSQVKKENVTNLNWLVYYLEDIQGHRILIDTGIESKTHASLYGIQELTSPSSILNKNKISPLSITDIFITHGHLDHIGGISASILMQIYLFTN